MALPSIDPQTLKAWLHDGQEIALLDAREDALKEKKGAIKAYLFTKCLPRVLENLVDDEDDD